MITAVRERPIIFSGEEVRAILEGRKSQFRRVIKPQPSIDKLGHFCWNGSNWGKGIDGAPYTKNFEKYRCPYGHPGDRLFVKETWAPGMFEGECFYRATFWKPHDRYEKWRPSTHMPRWASRILLEIVSVRVERLQDISEEDAKSEGVQKGISPEDVNDFDEGDGYFPPSSYLNGFANLWDTINAKRGHSWESNCWVWVVEFKVIEGAR